MTRAFKAIHARPENLKKSRPKNEFHEKKNSYQIPSIFYNFKNGQKSIYEQKSIFEVGKSLKLNVFHENLKKVQAKKIVKSNEFFFDQIPFFAILRMAKNQFLN